MNDDTFPNESSEPGQSVPRGGRWSMIWTIAFAAAASLLLWALVLAPLVLPDA